MTTPGTSLDRRALLQALIAFPAVWLRPGAVVLAAADVQPLLAQARRVVDAMSQLGEPFSAEDLSPLRAAEDSADAPRIVGAIDALFGRRCLVDVRINPEGRVSITRSQAPAQLVEQGWRAFLIKIQNEAGITGRLTLESPQARPVYRPSTFNAMAPVSVRPSDIVDRWLAIQMFDEKPLEPELSGLDIEYRIATLYSRDRGRREAQIGAIAGSGSEDIGFRNRVAVLFDVAPSNEVRLRLRDEHGAATMASLLIEDGIGRVYPARTKRLAPDFFFQKHVYRADGESVRLPPGDYTLTIDRGPEYVAEERRLTIGASGSVPPVDVQLKRWIDPPSLGWYSGDHHVHAAGCSHYESPTEGVRPEDMMRHVLGEALSVGAVLNWGPGYYHQRQFFEGHDNKLSNRETLLRYDLEVSGFPSSHCGHLVLLRLRDQDYPEVRQIEDWPSWDLPILKWAKAQGAVAGFAHSGWGLEVKSMDLPNYEIPPFDGIGANEYIADVTHDAVDFISACDTPFPHELNIWYHTLNCGFRTRISGETDFPCITDERVGAGRSYVRLDRLTYDGWCEGVRDGRSYVSDGFSHLLDFTANGVPLGSNGSVVALSEPSTITLSVRAACLLTESGDPPAAPNPMTKPYWTPTHARIGNSRRVRVEAIVNGRAAADAELTADGTITPLMFDVRIDRSSWVALRIRGSAHTNPFFCTVAGAPIRASRRSADWCLMSVDQCWSRKAPQIRVRERDAAAKAFDHARTVYTAIARESVDD